MCWFECFVDKDQNRDVHREMIDSHNFFIPPKDSHQFHRKVFLTTWGLLSLGDDGDLNEPSKWNHWTIAAKVWWSASQWAGHCEGWQWWENHENWCQMFGWSMIRKLYISPIPPKKVRFSEDFGPNFFSGWKLVKDDAICFFLLGLGFHAGKPNTIKGLQNSFQILTIGDNRGWLEREFSRYFEPFIFWTTYTALWPNCHCPPYSKGRSRKRTTETETRWLSMVNGQRFGCDTPAPGQVGRWRRIIHLMIQLKWWLLRYQQMDSFRRLFSWCLV